MRAGDPAFPRRMEDSPGLTKLEYFTAKAMEGLLANTNNDCPGPASIADEALRMAQAQIMEIDTNG